MLQKTGFVSIKNYGLTEKKVMDTRNNDVGRPPYLKKDEDSKTVEALAHEKARKLNGKVPTKRND